MAKVFPAQIIAKGFQHYLQRNNLQIVNRWGNSIFYDPIS